jgi:hypothetical protein
MIVVVVLWSRDRDRGRGRPDRAQWPCASSSAVAARTSTISMSNTSVLPASGWFEIEVDVEVADLHSARVPRALARVHGHHLPGTILPVDARCLIGTRCTRVRVVQTVGLLGRTVAENCRRAAVRTSAARARARCCVAVHVDDGVLPGRALDRPHHSRLCSV